MYFPFSGATFKMGIVCQKFFCSVWENSSDDRCLEEDSRKKTACRKFNFGCIPLDMADDEVHLAEETSYPLKWGKILSILQKLLAQKGKVSSNPVVLVMEKSASTLETTKGESSLKTTGKQPFRRVHFGKSLSQLRVCIFFPTPLSGRLS